MFQIEVLMNLQKNNEKTTNLIHHQYIEGSFLFIKRFLQRFKLYIYIYMELLDCETCHYPN